jgi:hypothetical protein
MLCRHSFTEYCNLQRLLIPRLAPLSSADGRALRRAHRRRLQQGQHPCLRHGWRLRTHLRCPGGRPAAQDAWHVWHSRHGWRPLISLPPRHSKARSGAERRELDKEFSAFFFFSHAARFSNSYE